MDRVVLWDFDGTLGHRPGMWSGSLVSAMDRLDPDHGFGIDDVRPYLQQGFPWHTPEVAHPELNEPEEWWGSVGATLRLAFEKLGYETSFAKDLVACARKIHIDPSTFVLFQDVTQVLGDLSAKGWRHIILSNHVPELPSIVRGLGLSSLVEHVVSSAAIGFEKPHPETYRIGLSVAGHPEEVWMVGDNPIADVQGAESVGVPAILCRNPPIKGLRCVSTLTEIGAWLS